MFKRLWLPEPSTFCEMDVTIDNEQSPVSFLRIIYGVSFTREGIFNTHKERVWAESNPYLTASRKYQARFSVKFSGRYLWWSPCCPLPAARSFDRSKVPSLPGESAAKFIAVSSIHRTTNVLHAWRSTSSYYSRCPTLLWCHIPSTMDWTRWYHDLSCTLPDLNLLDFFF